MNLSSVDIRHHLLLDPELIAGLHATAHFTETHRVLHQALLLGFGLFVLQVRSNMSTRPEGDVFDLSEMLRGLFKDSNDSALVIFEDTRISRLAATYGLLLYMLSMELPMHIKRDAKLVASLRRIASLSYDEMQKFIRQHVVEPHWRMPKGWILPTYLLSLDRHLRTLYFCCVLDGLRIVLESSVINFLLSDQAIASEFRGKIRAAIGAPFGYVRLIYPKECSKHARTVKFTPDMFLKSADPRDRIDDIQFVVDVLAQYLSPVSDAIHARIYPVIWNHQERVNP